MKARNASTIAIGLLAVAGLAWWSMQGSRDPRPQLPEKSEPPAQTEPAPTISQAWQEPLPVGELPPVADGMFARPVTPASKLKTPSAASDAAMSIGAGGDDFAARYDDLAARARAGDDAAAEELGTALLECKRFTRRLHDAESVVAPGRRFASPEAREAALGEAERFLEAENTRNFERKCRGLTQAQMDGFNDWYEMAALRGDIAAAYSYATLAPLAELAHDPAALMRYRDNASRLMHAAAGQCYGVAFASLANSYAHGTYTPRDPVRSMANNIVSVWLAGSEPSTERVTQQLQLARNATAPTELQLRQAQALARRLYSRHCQ